MTAFAIIDPEELGVDVRMKDDIDPAWGLVSGFACLAQDLLHRLTTERGGLFYDPDYGYNVVNLLNGGFTPPEIAAAQQQITAECRKDPRVRTCKVKVKLLQTNELRIDIAIDTEAGPFTMVMAATAVTVQILKVNNVDQVANDNASVPAGITVVVGTGGGSSVPGPPGPPGPGGSAQHAITFGDSLYMSSSGTEEWQAQREVNMGSLPASVTFEFVAQARSTAGTATFRLYLGGGDGAVDGTLVATFTSSSASFEEKIGTATISNPNGLKRLKLTIESSAPGEYGELQGVTVTIR